MPRYRVELEIQTPVGRPDESQTLGVEADSDLQAIAVASSFALRSVRGGKIRHAVATIVSEPEPVELEATPAPLNEEADAFARIAEPEMGAPAPIPTAAQRYLDETVASEALAFTRLSDEQAKKLDAMAKSLAPGCGVRLALELALATDRAQKVHAPKAHDFGKYGSADYCRRKDCQAKNQPPVNRWGCKGAA